MAQAAPKPRGRKASTAAASPPANAAGGAPATSATKARRRPTDGPADAKGPQPTLRILETRVLRGPNYWAREPVIRMLVDLGVLEEFPSQHDPGLHRRARRAAARRSRTTPARSAGAAASSPGCARARGSGHVAEHIALELQNLAGTDVRHGKTRARRRVRPATTCIYEYREEAVGLEAGQDRRRARQPPRRAGRPDGRLRLHAPELERLIRLAERPAFGPSTQALIDEAVSRDIPFIRLDRHSLVQLGQGVHQQRIRATMTSRTSAIGVDIASRQEPDQPAARLGRPARAASREVVDTEDGAVAAAQPDRLPVRGQAARRQPRPRRRTSTCAPRTPSAPPSTARCAESRERRRRRRDATSPATTTAASSSAARSRRSPSASRRSVVGDGEHTVRELVDIANRDPRRGIGHEKVLTRIKVDDGRRGARPRARASSSTTSRPRARGSSSP